LLDWSVYNKKIISLPFNRSTPLFYYNKDQLKAAGLSEKGPQTWEELESFARKLTIKGERWGFSCPIDIWFYLGMVFQNGGQILSADGKHSGFNNEIGTKPIYFWRKMIDEGIMKMPPGKEYNSWEVAMQDFLNGKTSMIMTSTGYLYGILNSAQGNLRWVPDSCPKQSNGHSHRGRKHSHVGWKTGQGNRGCLEIYQIHDRHSPGNLF
jgi:sn-glycerol 3-phosphate transport system substrate-binding protein